MPTTVADTPKTPAEKARCLLESYLTLGDDHKEIIVTALSNVIVSTHKEDEVIQDTRPTTLDDALAQLADDPLAQLSNQLESGNFLSNKKLSPEAREYIQQNQPDKNLGLDSDPPPKNSTRIITEVYTKVGYKWQYGVKNVYDNNDDDSDAEAGVEFKDLQQHLIGDRIDGDPREIRVVKGKYDPTYKYGTIAGFYSIILPVGDGSFLVIIGISKGLSRGIGGRLHDAHTSHVGRGYVTVITGIPVNTLENFELIFKKMSFPLRPNDHVGTELIQVDTKEDAIGFSEMAVKFAIDIVINGDNPAIPADIDHPEDDFISIKETTEDSVTHVICHPDIYQARYSTHYHQKFEKKDEQVENFAKMTNNDKFEYLYENYTQHGKELPRRHKAAGGANGLVAKTLVSFIEGMRVKLRNGTANDDEERGCAMIKVYASRDAANAARFAQLTEWTKDMLEDFLATLTDFQEKLGRIGKGKRPANPTGKKALPFTREEQMLGYRIGVDLVILRRPSSCNDGFKARVKIYVDRGLVEFMPDWDGKSSSAFSVPEMRAWNEKKRVVVNEPVYKPPKRALGKRKTPSNAGLTRAKRKAAVEVSSSTTNNRRSKRIKAPQEVEEEEACKLSEEIGDNQERIVPGIINAGNTCYAASALQLLFSSPPFIVGLSNTYISQTSLRKELPLTKAVLNVAKDIGLINDEGVVQSAAFTTLAVPTLVAANPDTLKVYLNDSMNDAASLLELKKIVDGKVGNFHDVVNPNDPPVEKDVYVASQHDAHEFVKSLLALVNKELANPKTDTEENVVAGTTSSLVDDSFRFEIREDKNCETCKYEWHKEDPSNELQVQIGNPRRPNVWNMERCLNFTFSKEKNVVCNCASGADCSGKTVTKTVKMVSSPPLLLLAMQRFEYVEERLDSGMAEQQAFLLGQVDKDGRPRIIRSQRKIKSKVTLDESITIQPYLALADDESNESSSTYMLRGVLHHTGTTSTSGHYVTYSKRMIDDDEGPGTREQWIEFDDKVGREKSSGYVIGEDDNDMKKNCYLALYERVSDSYDGDVEDASHILGGMKTAV